MNKFKNFFKKITKPTPLDKIIIGKAKPLEANKLEDSLIIELNEKICKKQRSAPREFHWDETFWMALCLSPMLYGVFWEFDNTFIRFLSIVLYVCICIVWGGEGCL